MPAARQCIAREANNPLGAPCLVPDVNHRQNAEPSRTTRNDHNHPALSYGHTIARYRELAVGRVEARINSSNRLQAPIAATGWKIPSAKANRSAHSKQASQPKRSIGHQIPGRNGMGRLDNWLRQRPYPAGTGRLTANGRHNSRKECRIHEILGPPPLRRFSAKITVTSRKDPSGSLTPRKLYHARASH